MSSRAMPVIVSAFLLIQCAAPGRSLSHEAVRTTSLPLWAVKGLRASQVSVWEQEARKRYEVMRAALNPYYLQGDFDGDGRTDVAVLVRRISNGKRGIAVLLRRAPTARILGAGTRFGNGGDDFSWMDQWAVRDRGSFEKVPNAWGQPLPPFRRDALEVEKSESASGLIYFDGKHYGWYQLGD